MAKSIALHVGPTGHTGSIVVDGVDLSNHIRAFTIHASVDGLAMVSIDFINVDIEFTADVIEVKGVVIPLASLDEIEPGLRDVTTLGADHRLVRKET